MKNNQVLNKLTKTNENFKEVLYTLQSNQLPLYNYLYPKIYSIDDYNISLLNTLVENRVLQVFENNKYFGLDSDNPIVKTIDDYINIVEEGKAYDLDHENKGFKEPLFALNPSVGISSLNVCPNKLNEF